MSTREKLVTVLLVCFLALAVYCLLDGPVTIVVASALGLVGTSANLSQARGRRLAAQRQRRYDRHG